MIYIDDTFLVSLETRVVVNWVTVGDAIYVIRGRDSISVSIYLYRHMGRQYQLLEMDDRMLAVILVMELMWDLAFWYDSGYFL